MLISSSSEPNGPKSKAHYIILHHNNKRDLVRLPTTYSDLEKLVQRLCHLSRGTFYVETKDLNICAGEKIRIPEEVWGDIAELLGNVHVVLDAVEHPEDLPEPNPEPISSSAKTLNDQVVPVTVESAPNPVYQQILECHPRVLATLEAIRKEITSDVRSNLSHGIKWRGNQIPVNDWSPIHWTFQPRSVFIVRYSLSKTSTTQLDFAFSPSECTSLSLSLLPFGNVTFADKVESGAPIEVYQKIALKDPMLAGGRHTVAFVNTGNDSDGNLHVIFDFKQFTVLQRTTFVARKPTEVYPRYAGTSTCRIEIEVYEF